MIKYYAYSGQLSYCVKTQGGKELSTHGTLPNAKKAAMVYTSKTGRNAEVWKYYGRVERVK